MADIESAEMRGSTFLVTLAFNTKQIDIDGKIIQLVPGMHLTADQDRTAAGD